MEKKRDLVPCLASHCCGNNSPVSHEQTAKKMKIKGPIESSISQHLFDRIEKQQLLLLKKKRRGLEFTCFTECRVGRRRKATTVVAVD